MSVSGEGGVGSDDIASRRMSTCTEGSVDVERIDNVEKENGDAKAENGLVAEESTAENGDTIQEELMSTQSTVSSDPLGNDAITEQIAVFYSSYMDPIKRTDLPLEEPTVAEQVLVQPKEESVATEVSSDLVYEDISSQSTVVYEDISSQSTGCSDQVDQLLDTSQNTVYYASYKDQPAVAQQDFSLEKDEENIPSNIIKEVPIPAMKEDDDSLSRILKEYKESAAVEKDSLDVETIVQNTVRYHTFPYDRSPAKRRKSEES